MFYFKEKKLRDSHHSAVVIGFVGFGFKNFTRKLTLKRIFSPLGADNLKNDRMLFTTIDVVNLMIQSFF